MNSIRKINIFTKTHKRQYRLDKTLFRRICVVFHMIKLSLTKFLNTCFTN